MATDPGASALFEVLQGHVSKGRVGVLRWACKDQLGGSGRLVPTTKWAAKDRKGGGKSRGGHLATQRALLRLGGKGKGTRIRPSLPLPAEVPLPAAKTLHGMWVDYVKE
eukprot:Sspe_Gene.90684::Locus_62185_Transcript_2_2_Confidence_0.750_Length_362::g.90684::m.90684